MMIRPAIEMELPRTQTLHSSFSYFRASAPLREIRTWFLGFLSLLLQCTPSVVIERKYVTYNFSDEGFLSPGMIQTIGKSVYAKGEPTLDASRLHCLENALVQAREKMLRIMVHTKFRLKAGSGQLTGLEKDYPRPLSQRDMMRADADFGSLLDRGYIALQDVRSTDSCSIIYRLVGENLPEEIKSVETTFKPELLKNEARRSSTRNPDKMLNPGSSDTR